MAESLKFMSFNFLASLINGNWRFWSWSKIFQQSFNFLASLINGNNNGSRIAAIDLQTFNFLASLINGNRTKAQSSAHNEDEILLTSQQV